MSADRTLRVAIAQPYTKLGDVEGNLAQVLQLAEQASAVGCEIILLPEVALHGYSIPQRVLDRAIGCDGPETEALRAHAVQKRIAIAAGAFERDAADGSICISHFIALPDGELVVQRKHGGHEKPGIARAPFEQKVFEVGGVRCGVTICIDCRTPGIHELLVDLGCELHLVPTAGGGAYGRFSLEDFEDDRRYAEYLEAMQNSCFPKEDGLRRQFRLRMALATANLATGDDGADYFQQGHSMLIDSDGDLVALIPGTHVQEHFHPRLAWGDIHPRTPRRAP